MFAESAGRLHTCWKRKNQALQDECLKLLRPNGHGAGDGGIRHVCYFVMGRKNKRKIIVCEHRVPALTFGIDGVLKGICDLLYGHLLIALLVTCRAVVKEGFREGEYRHESQGTWLANMACNHDYTNG